MMDAVKTLNLILVPLLLFGTLACDGASEKYLWNAAWNQNESKPDPEPDSNPEPVPEIKGKGRYVWIDAAANFEDYANDIERIAEDLARIKETGFTDVIVDVRPSTNGVLFTSSVEGPLERVDAWTSQGYVWLYRTADFDYLQAFIDEGHKLGLRVNASINTMTGGYKCPYGLGEDGILFKDTSKKDWAVVLNTDDGLVNVMDIDESGAKFFNPANDEVVDYMTNLLSDLAAYDLDGIILDRCRYDDHELLGDFSDVSRDKFEDYIGHVVTDWPDDIFEPGTETLPAVLTDIQKKWLEFRAKTIHDFIVKASERVHSVNSDIRFGAYVGAWYSSYYGVGVNWASPQYETSADFSWASEDYNEYGFADHCDIMIIGAYASASKIYGSSEWYMQGFCSRAETLFAGDVPYVGGPDIGNADGFENGGQQEKIPQIIDACINSCTGGMFVFDLCHIKKFDYWDAFKEGFDDYMNTLY